jgi:hypothetical protein
MVGTHAGRQQEGRKELERNCKEVIVGRKKILEAFRPTIKREFR